MADADDPFVDEPTDRLLPYLRAVIASWEHPDGTIEQELTLFHRGADAARHRDEIEAAAAENERKLLALSVEKQLITPNMRALEEDDAPMFRGKRYPPRLSCVVFTWREQDGIHQGVQLCESKREADFWVRNLKDSFGPGREEFLAVEIQVKPVPAAAGD